MSAAVAAQQATYYIQKDALEYGYVARRPKSDGLRYGYHIVFHERSRYSCLEKNGFGKKRREHGHPTLRSARKSRLLTMQSGPACQTSLPEDR